MVLEHYTEFHWKNGNSDAEELAERAVDIYRHTQADAETGIIRLINQSATNLLSRGLASNGLARLELALSLARRGEELRPAVLALALQNMAVALTQLGRKAEAANYLQEEKVLLDAAVDNCENKGAEASYNLIAAQTDFAVFRQTQGDTEEAREHFRR